MRSLPLPSLRAPRAAELLPTKRQYRARSLLPASGRGAIATALGALLLLLGAALPALALNEPQLRQTFPRDLGRVTSVTAATLRATFDRDLQTEDSTFRLRDNTTALVPGARGFDDVSATGGPRSITFAPAAPLGEALSPYTAKVKACAALPSVPCGIVSWSFFIDDTAPAAPVITSPTWGQFRTDQPVLVQGTAEAGAQILIAEDKDPTNIVAMGWTSNTGSFIVPLPYGPEDGVDHLIRAYARDEAGNDSAPSPDVKFHHDSVFFRPIITSPFAGQVFATTTVPVAGIAKAGSLVMIDEGGPPVATATTGADRRWATSMTALEGTHTITAYADDGSVTDGPSNAVTFLVDLTAPLAPVIVTPAPGSYVPTQVVLVSGTAEPSGRVRISEGATLLAETPADAAGDWGADVTLPDGPHTLSVVAADAAGNVSPAATVTFTVDIVPPVAPTIVSPSEGEVIPTTAFSVDGKAETGSLVTLYEGSAVVGTDTATGTGDWLIPALFADGAHDLRATAQDLAGNLSDPSLLRHFGVDTAAPATPQILTPGVGEVTERAEVLVSGAGEPNAGITVYEAAVPLGTASALSDGTWRTTLILTAGTHTLDADATDLAGNVSSLSASVTFDVDLPPADVTPPGAPTITAPSTSSVHPGFVEFRGFAEPKATVFVIEGSAILGSVTADSAGFWKLGVVLDTGPHTVFARAADPAGNVGPNSSFRTFSVDATRPTVSIDAPPLIVPGLDVGVFTPLAGITGSAADATGVVRVDLEFVNKLSGALVLTTTANTCTGCPGTSVTWEADQPPAGYYRVDVFSVDTVGNRSQAASLTFLTTGVQ